MTVTDVLFNCTKSHVVISVKFLPAILLYIEFVSWPTVRACGL